MFYIIMLRRFYDVYSLVVRMYMCDLKMQSEFVGDCVGELSYRAECMGDLFYTIRIAYNFCTCDL